MKKAGFFNINIRDNWKFLPICICFMIGLFWSFCIYIYMCICDKYIYIYIYIYIYYIYIVFLWCSKVQEINMLCERPVNGDQWQTFSGNCKPIRVWSWLVYKFTENNCQLRLFSEFIRTQRGISYLPWKSKYPNLKTTCHIKPKFFFWT